MTQEFVRPVAHRALASEIVNSTIYEKPGDKQPNWLVTPLGTRMNKVVVAGVVTSIEDKSPDTSSHFWQVDLQDLTGSVRISAGTRFGPNQAADLLAEVSPGDPVLFIGKTTCYEPEEGRTFMQVNAFAAVKIAKDEYDSFMGEAFHYFAERFGSLQQVPEGTEDALDKILTEVRDGLRNRLNLAPQEPVKVDVPATVVETPQVEPAEEAPLTDPVESVAEEAPAEPVQATQAAPTVEATPAPTGEAPEAPPASQELHKDAAFQAKVTELIKAHEADPATKGENNWDALLAGLKEYGDDDTIEEALNGLMDEGVVYEPTLGRLALP